MTDSFNSYVKWIRDHKSIWEFERDDNPADTRPIMLRKTHTSIMEALLSAPSFVHPNAMIHERAVVQGNVVIEDGVQILPDAVINGPAFLGRNSVVGNFSLLRTNCFLARDSLVGNHCYCNEAVIGRSARIAHFANFSRSILAYNSSVSAFVITATVKADKSELPPTSSRPTTDSKRGCTIGANTFVAPHVLILPGIDIGNRSFIGSFTIISHDIPDDTYVEVLRDVKMISNHIQIPRRKKVDN